jgi:hypothetical protein
MRKCREIAVFRGYEVRAGYRLTGMIAANAIAWCDAD